MKHHILLLVCFSIYFSGSGQNEPFDIHVHLRSGEESVQAYLKQLDSTHQQISGFGGIHMARKGEIGGTREKNDELITLSQRHPKLLPVCSVHPLDGEAALEELRRLAGKGVRIIKLHPHTQNFEVTDNRVLKLCKEAGRLGIAVLMDNANIKPGDSENLFDLAVKSPGTNFVFAHMGGLNFRFWNILPLARTAKGFYSENIYFDLSATIILMADSPLEEEFIWTLRNVGINKIILGSDFPQFTLREANDALEALDLEATEKNMIRYANARSLLFPDVSR